MEVALFLGCIGLFIGSFLRSFVYRLHTNQPFFLARSVCPLCHNPISWFDNIPIIAYLMRRGKCRSCHKPIHISYFLSEILAGLLFFLTSLFFYEAGYLVLLVTLLSVSALFAVFFSDFLYQEIPTEITIVPAVIILAVHIFLLDSAWQGFLLAASIGSGFFWLQYVVSRGKWIGGGDVRLGVLLGAIVGWPLILVVLFFSYIIGGAIGIVLLSFKKKQRKDEIAFGTILSAVTGGIIFIGPPILEWVMRLI